MGNISRLGLQNNDLYFLRRDLFSVQLCHKKFLVVRILYNQSNDVELKEKKIFL